MLSLHSLPSASTPVCAYLERHSSTHPIRTPVATSCSTTRLAALPANNNFAGFDRADCQLYIPVSAASSSHSPYQDHIRSCRSCPVPTLSSRRQRSRLDLACTAGRYTKHKAATKLFPPVSPTISAAKPLPQDHHRLKADGKQERKSKKQAGRRASRLALPRPHPQPRMWAAAARSSPLRGSLPWGQPAPPALELLQSLSDFKQPRRVYTEPHAPLPSRQQGHNVTVGDVVKAAQAGAHARAKQRGEESREGAGKGKVEAQGQEGGTSKVAGAGMEGAVETDRWKQQAEGGVAGNGRVIEAPGSLARTSHEGRGEDLEGKGKDKGEEPTKVLDEAVNKANTVVLNSALAALGAARLVPALDEVFKRVMASGKANSHTWASLFGAYADAGRPDLAIAQFEQACRKGTDIGPMGASALVKLCANQDDLDMGLELFYKMTSTRTTFNRYIYNCLLHLCGTHGRVYDGLDLLAAMRADGSIQEDCKPDGYTYSALLRAVTVSQKWELLPLVYKQMVRDKVGPLEHTST
ncbi:hypothetical protein DUNSADRAFT_8720 [Dunaliella salina]|uniref:PROP1-like PPR domain-containing protein n=1 Tax=Dunaliella salina TaxID=3046 RepID=A0ABQ7GIW2_DUNSA|nr:hypothetical protein DUNSADRAFT_8720 [Dunaliella salina]|eukprot:KAF5834553.1 hypothetical protein DUNSADRAFT_8720 [Dunaliella salina]